MNEVPIRNGEIGAALKKARTQRGISLESVTQKIRIPKKFLEALEAERFEELPGPVYLRGFLRSYCEFLDIEFEPLWNRVSSELPSQKPAQSAGPSPEAAAPGQPVEVPSKPGPALLGGLALAGVILVAAIGLWQSGRGSRPSNVPPPSDTTPIQPLNPRRAMSLELQFPDRTWLRLEADKALKFEGWAPSGARQTWSANDSFEIRTPRPSAVKLSVDGKEMPLENFPKDGEGDILIQASSL